MGPVVNLSRKAYFPLNNHSIPIYIISPPTVIFSIQVCRCKNLKRVDLLVIQTASVQSKSSKSCLDFCKFVKIFFPPDFLISEPSTSASFVNKLKYSPTKKGG